MIRGTIKVEGLKEATDKLRQVEKKMVKQKRNPGRKALASGAQIMVDEAKRLAPYDSSINDGIHIRENIGMRSVRTPEVYGLSEVFFLKPFGFDVYYWRFNEFGGLRTEALRFMTKAFDTKKMEFLKVFAREYKQEIEQIIREVSS